MGVKIVQATIGNLPALLRSGKPVVLDFWAGWCAPCHVMAPILRGLAREFDGKVVFAKVDVQNNRDLATQFDIRSIPTLILFRGGKPAQRIVGYQPKANLRQRIDAVL